MLSNSSTEFVRELYSDYEIKVVKAKRSINSNGARRGRVDEVVVVNRLQNRCLRVECKWQQSAGSVDEKFPYLYLNCVYAFEEQEIVLIIDGGGYKPGARKWLENSAKDRWLLDDEDDKLIKVMTISEFTAYFNKEWGWYRFPVP